MTPEEVALLLEGARNVGVEVDEAAQTRIDRFLAVLETWNRRLRLTGERDRETLLGRHVIDSLAPCRWLPARGVVIDVGSGAGFPGTILACVRPDLVYALIEARRRRASFLAEVVRSLPLPGVSVVGMRAEDAAREETVGHIGRVVITRALRLDVFLPLAAGLIAPDGVAVAMQTPGARAASRATADACGFRLSDVYDYALPDSRKRSLLLFTPR